MPRPRNRSTSSEGVIIKVHTYENHHTKYLIKERQGHTSLPMSLTYMHPGNGTDVEDIYVDLN